MNTDRPAIKVRPPVLYAGFLLTGLLLHFFFPWPVFDAFWIGAAAGALAAAFGAALLIWAVRTLMGAGVNPRFRPVGNIVQHGPYVMTRNPMYVGFTLIYLGVSAAVNTLWPVALLALVLAALHYGVILPEERYLEARFGQEYRMYRQKVRRWL